VAGTGRKGGRRAAPQGHLASPMRGGVSEGAVCPEAFGGKKGGLGGHGRLSQKKRVIGGSHDGKPRTPLTIYQGEGAPLRWFRGEGETHKNVIENNFARIREKRRASISGRRTFIASKCSIVGSGPSDPNELSGRGGTQPKAGRGRLRAMGLWESFGPGLFWGIKKRGRSQATVRYTTQAGKRKLLLQIHTTFVEKLLGSERKRSRRFGRQPLDPVRQ